jgi:gliding motility-associated-like protein
MLISSIEKKSSLLLFFLFLATYFCNALHAQLCNGSLGDAVVNITFGDGNTIDTAFLPPRNAYTYTTSPCPGDGFYTLGRANSTRNCFSGNWHTITDDHTGGGAYLLVNASNDPGDFFVTTVTDLCPNTKYEFAAWIVNVMRVIGIQPNITFSIETPTGTVLQQYSTRNISEGFPNAIWKQYGFFFTTPINNPVIVLRITNNAPGGFGNDLGLDDITFRPCSSAIISATIIGSSNKVDICEGNPYRYTMQSTVSTGFTSPSYQWQISKDSAKHWNDISGATSLTYQRQPTGIGSFWYRMGVAERNAIGIQGCRISSNNLVINVHENPVVQAGADRIMFLGDTILMNGLVTGDNPFYTWDPPDQLVDKTSLTTSASPNADKTYTLFAQSVFGCKNQDAMSVKVVADIFIPNAFTPNGDFKNDHWRIPYLDPILGAVINVYNRFGQLVYHADSEPVDWDGKWNNVAQSTGVYVYQIRFKKGRKDLSGTFLLIK